MLKKVVAMLTALLWTQPAAAISVGKMNELFQLLRMHSGIVNGPFEIRVENVLIRYQTPVYGNKRLCVEMLEFPRIFSIERGRREMVFEGQSAVYTYFIDDNADGLVETISRRTFEKDTNAIVTVSDASEGDQYAYDSLIDDLIKDLKMRPHA